MDFLQEYALSIITTTLISSMVSGLIQNSAAKGIIRMVSGIILTITVAAPLWKIELTVPENFGTYIIDAATDAAAEGEERSREALRSIIKEETEAYIQDKAAEVHAQVTAEVILNNEDPPIPEGVVLSGEISPYAMQQLQKILETQLGIAKERLEWTG